MTSNRDYLSITLPATEESAAAARKFIREQTRLDLMRQAEADLLVTELVGNLIAHSPSASNFELRIAHEPGRRLRISVSHSHDRPLESCSPGMGTLLLDRLSNGWGHHHSDGVLESWFGLRTPGTNSISEEVTDEELFNLLPTDPAASSDELIRRHASLASSIARRFRGKGIDDEDLDQVAYMALLKAIHRYDPQLGQLGPYAAATISGELKRTLRDRGWSIHVPRSLQESVMVLGLAEQELRHSLGREPSDAELASHLDITEEEVQEARIARQAYVATSANAPVKPDGSELTDFVASDDQRLASADERLSIQQMIADLSDREREILHLRFNEDLTQEEIAERVGISQMHVSRILRKSVDHIRAQIERDPT